jgi:hypothetical protein
MTPKGIGSCFLSFLRQPRLTRQVLVQINSVQAGDLSSLPEPMREAADWLLEAQRRCPDGAGYSRRFRAAFGWDCGYVETTGYIIPTLLAVAARLQDKRYRASALAAGEWLLSRQNPDGSFSEIDHQTPQAFDTGQVLLGLNALSREMPARDDYRQAADRAAAWLVKQLTPEGTWATVAFQGRAHTYYSRSGAALLETGLMLGRSDYVQAAHRHLEWVISKQRPSGWFMDCEFEIGRPALLHTIVYVMEGLLMAHALNGTPVYHDAALRSAQGLQAALRRDGRAVPVAYYAEDWRLASEELCITGLAQWAGVCRRLDRLAAGAEFSESAMQALALLNGLQIRAPGPLRGALPNVIPWWGSYGKMGAYNWNTKFFIDAHLDS